MSTTPGTGYNHSLRLFIVSFLSLYVEMILIRWLPSEIYVLGYFKNAVLIASFLGLGLGMLTKGKRFELWLVPLLLVFTTVSVFIISNYVTINYANTVEYIWGVDLATKAISLDVNVILSFFLLLTIVIMVPLGKSVAQFLALFKPLVGYSINIGGSIVGVVVFFVLSFTYSSPLIWFSLVAVFIIPLLRGFRQRGIAVLSFVIILGLIHYHDSGKTFWSPYSKIEIVPLEIGSTVSNDTLSLGYGLTLNTAGHQSAIDYRESVMKNPVLLSIQDLAIKMHAQEISYSWVYSFTDRRDDILIVGSGMGNDVAIAIRQNAKRIDAVEIDPMIYELGKKYHPEKPYDDERVTVFITDARSYFEQCKKKYDIIIFSSLDSLSYLTGMSNIRLDNFVYTKESMQRAHDLLKEDGIINLMFSVREQWMGQRLYGMLEESFQSELYAYDLLVFPKAVIIATKGQHKIPDSIPVVMRRNTTFHESIALSTDNWPFLYMKDRSISKEYVWFVFLLLFISIVSTRVFVPDFTRINKGFFLLGSAFLLLETKSITTFSLLFGTTWWVTSLAFIGVLIMILIGNYLVILFPRIFTEKLAFCAISLSIIINYAIPVEYFLNLDKMVRMVVSIAIVTSPLAFAAIIFAKVFSKVKHPDNALGSNILGAVIGGILEYCCLLLGINFLYVIALLLYTLAMFFLLKRYR